jgi:hypothetical protein
MTTTTHPQTKERQPMTMTPFTWNRQTGLTTSSALPHPIAVAAAAALDNAEDGGNQVLDEYNRSWRLDGNVEYGRSSVEAEGLIAYNASNNHYVVYCDYLQFEYWGVKAPSYWVRGVCYGEQLEDADNCDEVEADVTASVDEPLEGWARFVARPDVGASHPSVEV